jgi:hypothetical protein
LDGGGTLAALSGGVTRKSAAALLPATLSGAGICAAFRHSAPAQRLFALLPSHTRQDFVGSIRSIGPEQQSWWFETMREDRARAV